MKPYLTFIISFLVTYFSLPLFRALAIRFKILDLPGERKIHKLPTPLLGGLGIYFGLLIGFLLNFHNLSLFLPLIICSTLIMFIGLIHDKQALSAQLRFLCQLIVSLMIIWFGVRIEFLPNNLWGNLGEILITVLWFVGITNAFNYLDGMDGLATGSAIINLFCFTIILYSTRQYSLVILAIILIAGCLGFLPYNFKKEKIFLGEAGSTFLGFSLAGIAVAGHWAADNVVKISIPILILGVPIFDMLFTTIIRIKEEKVKNLIEWLEYVGKDHFHHYLVDLGLSPLGAVGFIYFINLSLGISAIMLSNDAAIEAFLTLSQAAIIFGIIATLLVIGKRRHHE
jgi:UDP-GlcNAc:undecaprenyl-phosphate GlcNAc-1-phosphate transferase